MATATLTKPEPKPRVISHLPMLREVIDDLGTEQIAYFTDISWPDYEAAMEHRDVLHRGIRFFYDQGALEIMATSLRHELWKKMFGMIIAAMAMELKRRMLPGGEMTVRRKDLKKGFEPDECFYFANVDRVLGKSDLNFKVDPPPDLAIEVERTRSAIKKLSVYAAFLVPEIWRFNGTRITVLRLAADGEYVESPSQIFPEVNVDDLIPFIQMGHETDHTTVSIRFRDWAAKTLAVKKN